MKILVIGDSCTDIFIYGQCKRLCPEAPVPVFNPVEKIESEGMAGNVKRNLEALDCEVDIITNSQVITKTRYVDVKSNQMIMRLDENDNISERFDIKKLENLVCDAIVVSDYDKGFLTQEDLEFLSRRLVPVFLDTKKKLGDWAKHFTFVKINEDEWRKSECIKLDNLIITMGEMGCLYQDYIYPAKPSKSLRDVSGAGDTFLAGFVSKYLETKNINDSLSFANYCAGQVIQKRGVSVVNA